MYRQTLEIIESALARWRARDPAAASAARQKRGQRNKELAACRKAVAASFQCAVSKGWNGAGARIVVSQRIPGDGLRIEETG
jgi:hypothetical protein